MVIERDRRLSIRIAEDEWTMLQALADKEGLTASDYIRHFIRRAHAEAFGARSTPPKKKR